MINSILQLELLSLDSEAVKIILASGLGLFLGLEREWSQKSAGIRTFSLISLLAAVFVVLDRKSLLVVGGVLVIIQGAVLAARGLMSDGERGLSLTTSMSMLVAYSIGALVADGFVLEAVIVAVLSSLLLILKRELHSFAGGLSHEEMRSTTEFAILAFVIYPLLPAKRVTVNVSGLAVQIEPRVAWLMVVFVAGIGIVNYVIVKNYGGRGIAVTGFFGGLASSTAVVGTMLDHVRQHSDASAYAVAAILLANAAMALRNLVIVVVFTLPMGHVLVGAVGPLVVVILGSVGVAAWAADWREPIEMTLDSPFSLRNALGFGAIFTVVLLVGQLAEVQFSALGFYVTAVLSGLVSSAGVTASTVLLYQQGGISADTTTIAVLLATTSSIGIKAVLTAVGPSRELTRRVAIWSTVLLCSMGAIALILLI